MAKADHAVSLNMTAAITVGSRTVEVPVRRNGRRIGVLSISEEGVQWDPSTTRPPVSVSWEDLPSALTSVGASSTASSGTSSGVSATTSRASLRRTAASASGKRAATGSATVASAPAQEAPADETSNGAAKPKRSRPAGGSAARGKTAGAARQASGRTEATVNEVSSFADTPTTPASTGGALAVEALLEGAAPSGAPAPAETTADFGDTTADLVGSTVGEVDSEQVPGQQPLPLGEVDTLDSTGAGVQAIAEAGDTLTSLSVSGAEAEAEAAAQPRGRKAATRRSAKKAPPRQAGEPAAREVTSAPARANNVNVPGAGADTTALDARAVRQWAAAHGITVPPRGPLSTRVREQYLAAH